VPMSWSDGLASRPTGRPRHARSSWFTVWSAEHRDAHGLPERDPGSISYSAAIESAAQKDTEAAPSRFAARVEREALRRGFDQAPRQVVLGDGAKWIWNIAAESFPDAIQIVDRFHAKQHLSDVAKAIYGANSDLAAEWARKRHQELDAGNIGALLRALRRHFFYNEEAAQCAEYIDGNRTRMRYDQFREAGLGTSTGVVEAGCKTAIGVRCKRAGMHWTVAGVDAIIALRCSKLSGRLGDFWERRAIAQARQDRLIDPQDLQRPLKRSS
jgi:hypothetical protein